MDKNAYFVVKSKSKHNFLMTSWRKEVKSICWLNVLFMGNELFSN